MELGFNPERFFFLSVQPICTANMDGYLTMVNPAMERLVGWPAKELLSRPFTSFVYLEDLERTREAYKVLLDGEPLINFENRYRTQEGKLVWVQWNCVTDKTSNVIYAHATDVTYIKEQQELYKAVVNDQSELICRHLPDATITFVNHAFCMFFGSTPEKLIGRKKAEIFSPETMEQLVAAHKKITKDNPIVSYESELKSPIGHSYWFWWRNHGFFDEDGELKHVQSVATDITPIKKAREKLKDSEARLKLFIDKTPAAIAIFDDKMNYLFASQRWYKDYNIKQDIIGRSHYEVFPDLPEKWKASYAECLKEGLSVKRDEDLFIRADGSVKWLRWEAYPWYKDNREAGGLILFTEDITETITAREKLSTYSVELEHKTKELEKALKEVGEASHAKSLFLACMSHELRTPLNAIIGFSEVMKNEVFGSIGNDKYLEYCKDINGSGTHLLGLINDVLDLSKIEAGKIEIHKEPANLHHIVEEAVILVQQVAEKKGIGLKSANKEDLMLICDTKAIRQVIINLLNNSVKFTPYGGQVEVSYCMDDKPDFIKISVSDNGVGIPESNLNKLFTPFYQGKHDYSLKGIDEGAGLGLAIVKRLVEKHRGDIDISTTVGKGTTIAIRLPQGNVSLPVQAPQSTGSFSYSELYVNGLRS